MFGAKRYAFFHLMLKCTFSLHVLYKYNTQFVVNP